MLIKKLKKNWESINIQKFLRQKVKDFFRKFEEKVALKALKT